MIQPKFVKKPAKKKPWVKPEIRKISREEYKAMLKTRERRRKRKILFWKKSKL